MELSYRNLEIWHKSLGLIKSVYRASEQLPKCEDEHLKLRLRKAVVSVALNIAEGKSRKTSREFAELLNVSNDFLHEVDTVLVICLELGYLKSIDAVHSEIAGLAKLFNAHRRELGAN